MTISPAGRQTWALTKPANRFRCMDLGSAARDRSTVERIRTRRRRKVCVFKKHIGNIGPEAEHSGTWRNNQTRDWRGFWAVGDVPQRSAMFRFVRWASRSEER